MNISFEEKDGVSILNLAGRMDATTVIHFEDAFRSKIEENASKIIINLAELEYISSAGLRGILIAEKSSKANKSTLAFCTMQDMVAEVFKISGFNSILKVYATQEEAMAAFA